MNTTLVVATLEGGWRRDGNQGADRGARTELQAERTQGGADL
jgi:hypothetical protein